VGDKLMNLSQLVYSSVGGAQAHHGERYSCRNRRRDRDPRTGQGSTKRIGRGCRQAQAWPAREGYLSCCSESSEDQKAPQDERGSAGAHPAGADQALGRVERYQGEHERYGCATAQGEEEGRKGRLIGLGTFSDVDEIWAFDRALCLGIISATYQVATYQVQSLRFTR